MDRYGKLPVSRYDTQVRSTLHTLDLGSRPGVAPLPGVAGLPSPAAG